MKKSKLLILGLIVLVLAGGLALAGCPTACNDGCGWSINMCSNNCKNNGGSKPCKEACN